MIYGVKSLLEVQHDHAAIFARINLAFDAVVQIKQACVGGMRLSEARLELINQSIFLEITCNLFVDNFLQDFRNGWEN